MFKRKMHPAVILLSVPAILLLIGAGLPKKAAPTHSGLSATGSDATVRVITKAPVDDAPATATSEGVATSGAPNFSMDWLSINSGGEIDIASSSFQMGMSVGQPVAGPVTSASYQMGYGFWYGVAGPPICPIAQTGELNGISPVSASDIIFMVNLILKAGPEPSPCLATADVNCSGTLTTGDIIYLVNFVFKAGPPPCDVCSLIPGTWSCP